MTEQQRRSIPVEPCVAHFIDDVQQSFQNGNSFSDVPGEIRHFQTADGRLRRNLSGSKRIIHSFAVSTVTLGSIALYEFLRYKGVKLPDSLSVARKAVNFGVTGTVFAACGYESDGCIYTFSDEDEGGCGGCCRSEDHDDWHRRTGVPFGHGPRVKY